MTATADETEKVRETTTTVRDDADKINKPEVCGRNVDLGIKIMKSIGRNRR
jgi:hypothetical protein